MMQMSRTMNEFDDGMMRQGEWKAFCQHIKKLVAQNEADKIPLTIREALTRFDDGDEIQSMFEDVVKIAIEKKHDLCLRRLLEESSTEIAEYALTAAARKGAIELLATALSFVSDIHKISIAMMASIKEKNDACFDLLLGSYDSEADSSFCIQYAAQCGNLHALKKVQPMSDRSRLGPCIVSAGLARSKECVSFLLSCMTEDERKSFVDNDLNGDAASISFIQEFLLMEKTSQGRKDEATGVSPVRKSI